MHNLPDAANASRVAPEACAALAPLPVGRYRFTATLSRPFQAPDYAGPLLRGVFGAALRQGACSTGQANCRPCPLARGCAYSAIFETPPRDTQFQQRFDRVPNPYVIEPPPIGALDLPAGKPLVFHMVLAGEATQRQLPLIVLAWQRALRHGLGQARVPGELQAVDRVGADGTTTPWPGSTTAGLKIVDQLELGISQPPKLAQAWGEAAQGVALHFHTPLRLQHQSKILRPHQLTPRVLISHLLRRINLMLDLHMDRRPAPYDAASLVSLASRLSDDRSQLRWYDMHRYSARQRQALPQSGALGPWALHGDVRPLLPWLTLGQWLHIGKSATMGLGGYRLLPPGSGSTT